MMLLLASPAFAFCGTFVGAAGADLRNEASQVVIAREGTRTVLTLAADYQGDLSAFGLLIPLPEAVSAEDVRLADINVVARLEDWSTPRLVSYTCDDVLEVDRELQSVGCQESSFLAKSGSSVEVVEAFSVGEYDISVLSAEESADLLGWLDANGYAAPEGGEAILQEYIDAGVYFLAAKVTLDRVPDGRNWLSPLQIAYDAEGWMLPIRIGTINAGDGAQDVLIYTLTDEAAGATGISNYPEVKPEDECMLPTGDDFAAAWLEEVDATLDGQAGWVTEYSWSLTTSCDPCTSTQGLTPEELEALGWPSYHGWLTRIRMRYTAAQATQDLTLYSTGIAEASQVRMIQYNPELEYLFPVCGEGMVDNPGMCAGAEEGPVIGCGASDNQGAGMGILGALGALVGLASARRRK